MEKPANALATFLLVMSPAFTQMGDQSQVPTDPSRQPMFVKFENLKWEKITTPRGDCTFELAQLRVDPKTQATSLIIRHPANCYVPKHWHTGNEMITLIRGTFVLECEGTQDALEAGSMGYVPSKMIHRAWTKPNQDALYFVHVDAAWDVNWVEDKSQPGKRP